MVGYEDGNACEPDGNGCSLGARFESVSIKRLGYKKVEIEFQKDEKDSNIHGPYCQGYIRKLVSLLGGARCICESDACFEGSGVNGRLVTGAGGGRFNTGVCGADGR